MLPIPNLNTMLAVATFVGSGFAALFGYLNWVYSTNRGRMEAEREINERWEDFHYESDSPRVQLIPARILMRQDDNFLYRVRRALIPLTQVKGQALVKFKSRYDSPEVFQETIRNEDKDGFWFRKTNVNLHGTTYTAYMNRSEMIYLIFDFDHPDNIRSTMGDFYQDFILELEAESRDTE